MRCIKSYTITSQEALEKRQQEMIDIANATNSRIYIHPAKRNAEKVAKEMLTCLAEHFTSWKHNLSWLYNTACWQKVYEEKLWVVDVDNTLNKTREIAQQIRELNPDCIVNILETINGWHIITKPFNRQIWLAGYNIDVHTNNPTLLYFNIKYNEDEIREYCEAINYEPSKDLSWELANEEFLFNFRDWKKSQ